jgi:hypothetical protein
LKSRGGGLLLGTDHSFGGPLSDSYTLGINSVNVLIGLNQFFGQFGLGMTHIAVDTNSPLMKSPNDLGSVLWADYTPGEVPFGLQPNGKMLNSLAWYLGNQETPGISTTIDKTNGYRVWITSPPSSSIYLSGQPITFSVDQTNGFPPYRYTWTSDKDGLLGTGTTLICSSLSTGAHAITVTGVDSVNQIDNDSIRLTVATTNLNIAVAVEIWWPSVTGLVYQPQWSPEVEPRTWQDFGPPIAGNGTNISVFDSTRYTGRKFYRLLTQ